jgi:S1-C subfamily serine protease
VFEAAGGLLGMATAGPDRRGLVIPAATIDRVIGPLLATGRIARGWLGLGMQPVALDDDLATQSGNRRGLMVMRVAPGGRRVTSSSSWRERRLAGCGGSRNCLALTVSVAISNSG